MDDGHGEVWQQVQCPDWISGCPSEGYFINTVYQCKYYYIEVQKLDRRIHEKEIFK